MNDLYIVWKNLKNCFVRNIISKVFLVMINIWMKSEFASNFDEYLWSVT